MTWQLVVVLCVGMVCVTSVVLAIIGAIVECKFKENEDGHP